MVSEQVIVASLQAALQDRRRYVDAAKAEIEKKDAVVKSLTKDVEQIRNRFETEEAGRKIRSRAKTLIDLRNVLYTRATERDVVDRVRRAFGRKQLRSSTEIVYDPNVNGRRSAEQNSLRNAKIVVGKFGIGIRENINSRGIYGYEDILYILRRLDLMLPKMRELKLNGEADALEALYAKLPNFPQDGIEVELPERVQFIDPDGYTSHAVRVLFERSWVFVLYERDDGSMLYRVHVDPTSGNGAYLAWMQVKESVLEPAFNLAEGQLRSTVLSIFGEGTRLGRLAMSEETFKGVLVAGLTSEENQLASNIVLERVDHALGRLLMINSL